MVVIDRKYAGAAVLAHVSGAMTAASPANGATFTVDDDTGYPVTGKFPVVIDRGLATEEKILISSRSGTTFTVSAAGGRGYDGTSAQSHNASATCELALDAVSVNLMVDHVDDVEVDPHSTKLLNNTRHDVTARHTFGAALGTPGTPAALTPDIAGSAGAGSVPARSDHVHNVPAAVPVAVGTALAEGAGTSFARDNHVHTIGAGAINSTTMFGAQSVPASALVNDSVTATQLAPDSVGASELAAGAVAASGDIANGIVTLAKMASEASTAFVPDFPNVTIGGGSGTKYGQYFKLGRLVVGIAGFRIGSGGNVTGNVEFTAPFDVADYFATLTSSGWLTGGRSFDNSANASYASMGVIFDLASGNLVSRFATAGATASWDQNTPFDWAVDDQFQCFFMFEATS